MKKVSIIVPVYNVEKYLKKCLDSLVNQTLKDIEIIVVNDGSTDNSEKIIKEYQEKYKNLIKGYTKTNGGLSDARNFGIKKATGEYIGFVDSDDYVDKTMFEKMYLKITEDEGYDVVICDTLKVDENNEIYLKSNYNYSKDNKKNYLLAPPMVCSRLYKADLFANEKFTKNIYYEDLELSPRILKHANNIAFLEEGLYYYVQRSGSIMKQLKFSEKLLDIFKVLDKNYEILFPDYKEEVEYMYITHLLRTATLRFLDYENYKSMISKIVLTMKDKFPNWKKNEYYKKSSNKLKLICFLAYHKQIKILKLIKKLTNY